MAARAPAQSPLPRNPRPCIPTPGSRARGLPAPRNLCLAARRAHSSGHLGCTLQSVPRSWPELFQGRRTGLRPGWPRPQPSPRRALASAALHVPGSGVRLGQQGRRAARAGKVRPAPPGRATEGAGMRRGTGGQVTRGAKPQAPQEPPELVALPKRLTSCSQGPAPLAALVDINELPERQRRPPAPGPRAALCGTEAQSSSLTAGPPGPRGALPLRGGVGRGGKELPPASQVGRAGQVLPR